MGVEWFAMLMGLGFVLSFGYWSTDLLVMQRAMAAESMGAARRTSLVAAVPKMFFPFLVIFPGMIAIALTEGHGWPAHASPIRAQLVMQEKGLTAGKIPDSNQTMKSKAILATALWLVTGSALIASPLMGTWKLDESKSQLDPAMGKNTTVIYAKKDGKVKITVDGVDAKGKPTHNEWVGKFDGKDYAVTGDQSFDMRSYKQVNDRTLSMTLKKEGKIVGSGLVTVSQDGKTRTVQLDAMTPKGKKSHLVAVYSKS